MMDDGEMRSQLTRIFRDVFDEESLELYDGMTAKDVEEWDSLNHINLIFAVERHFKVKFTTREAADLQNVGEFIELLKSKLA